MAKKEKTERSELAEPTKTACDIFTDRLAFLLASVADTRKGFECLLVPHTYYALAVSEHAFKLALFTQLYPVKALSKRDMQRMIREDWQEATQTED